MLKGKRVLIGITGGIAAYKICTLIRLFKRQNADVRVVVTPNALNFVTKLTLQTLSQNEVYSEMFDVPEWKPGHIALTEADGFVIAPCSANTLGKLAYGLADNLLTSTALAFKNPILIAPAMNDGMWENKIVQDNIKKIKSAGYKIIEPRDGLLACGTSGKGRMPEPQEIFEEAVKILDCRIADAPCNNINLKGQKIIVTAGGTIEKIDPVRYITNNSSGKMGEAIADYAYECGADVTLVSTKKVEKPYEVIVTQSAKEMFETVKTLDFDSIFMAAAVSDYRVKEKSTQKIKKGNSEGLTLELVQNPDILKYLCENKKQGQIVVGFCAESENLIENAQIKIEKKGCDFLVANDISRKDIGFGSDENEVYLFDKNKDKIKIKKAPKKLVAQKIMEYVYGKN